MKKKPSYALSWSDFFLLDVQGFKDESKQDPIRASRNLYCSKLGRVQRCFQSSRRDKRHTHLIFISDSDFDELRHPKSTWKRDAFARSRETWRTSGRSFTTQRTMATE